MKFCAKHSLLLFFLVVQVNSSLWGQTCCTAGVPVGTYLGIQNQEKKSFSLQFGYEYNSINLLIDNNEELENDPRTRNGQSFSLKGDYTLNKKFAFSVIVPLIQQARSTMSESQSSFGLGDPIFLTQYSPINDQFRSLNFSAGVKVPFGTTSHRSDSGILLSPDMQSGSGSLDFIFRAAYSKSNFITPFLSAYINGTLKLNGTNSDFGSTPNFSGRSFSFGDEAISQLGLRYLLTLKKGFLTPDISAKFRWTDSNIEQDVDAPNSGGYWISVPIGISFAPDNYKSIAVVAEFPVYQNLDGLQITTDFKFGVQMNYTFQKKKTKTNDFILN